MCVCVCGLGVCGRCGLVHYLILLQTTVGHGLVSLLLEGDDDQSHEDVDKEEGEHHEVDHIEDGHLHTEAGTGAQVLVCGVY